MVLLFVCSLMTTCPPAGSEMVWFGAPETAIVWPLMTRLASSELPEVAGPFDVQTAIAEAMRKSAEMELPPTVRLTSATDASERLRSPWPTVEACSTSTESKPGTLADSKEASWAPPEDGSGPVSERTTGLNPNTVA